MGKLRSGIRKLFFRLGVPKGRQNVAWRRKPQDSVPLPMGSPEGAAQPTLLGRLPVIVRDAVTRTVSPLRGWILSPIHNLGLTPQATSFRPFGAGYVPTEFPRFPRQSRDVHWVAGILIAALCITCGVSSVSASEKGQWTHWRGNAQQTGVAQGTLPDKLRPLWTFQIPEGIESSAAIAEGTVFIGGLDGFLYALSLESGQVKWKYKAEEEIKSSPSYRQGVIYFGDEMGTFHALDAATGKARWTFKTEGGITSSANFAGSRVLFGSYDNFLYCLNIADGSLAWKLETGGYVHATPGIYEGFVTVTGCDATLRIIRISDGEQAGQVDLGGYVASSPAILGDRAYFGSFENEVLCVDLKQQHIQWAYQNPKREFPYYSSPAVNDQAVVIGGRDKLLHALNPRTGEELWNFPTKARVESSPVIVGDRVFFGAQSGEVFAIDMKTGKPVWEFDSGSGFVTSPAIADGKLVIGSLDGDLFCFGE